MIETFDTKVQSLFQWFNDFSQLHFGKNCYWWAYITVSLAGVLLLFAAYEEWQRYMTADSSSTIMSIVFICAAIILAASKFLNLNALKRMSESDQPQILPLSMASEDDLPMRMFELALGMSVFFHVDIVGFVFLALTCSSYLLRCNPRPPTRINSRQVVV